MSLSSWMSDVLDPVLGVEPALNSGANMKGESNFSTWEGQINPLVHAANGTGNTSELNISWLGKECWSGTTYTSTAS